MAIKEFEITEQQRGKILALNEGHFVDLKSKDISPAKLTRHISAFANADGGELYIGINENKLTGERTWDGFINEEDANGFVQCFESIFPLGQEFEYEFISCGTSSGLVLHVETKKAVEIKNASDGKAYLRRGAQSLPQDTLEQIERLKLNKGLSSFETQTLDVELENVTNSYTIIDFLLQIIPFAEPVNWLKKQQLIKTEKPTVAAALLFSDEPQALLPKR